MLSDDASCTTVNKLSHADPIIRKLGAQELARGGLNVPLIAVQHAILEEHDAGVVKWLALALGNMRDPSSIPFLEGKRRLTEDSDTRQWIDVALSRLKPFRRDRVLDLFASTSALDVRSAAAESWDNPELDATLKHALLKNVEHSDATVRQWSILSLGTTDLLTEAAPLLAGLDDSNFLIREWTEWSLATLLDPKAYAALMYRLNDDHPRVREWAIKAISRYDSPEIADVLVSRFKQEGDLQCQEAIIRSLRKWRERDNVRSFFATLLGSPVGSPVLLMALIDTLASGSHSSTDLELVRALVDHCLETHSSLIRQELSVSLVSGTALEDVEAIRRALSTERNRLVLATALPDFTPSTGVPHVRPSARIYSAESTVDQRIDIGLIVALREEFDYLTDLAKFSEPVFDDDKVVTYYPFLLPSSDADTPFQCVAVVSGMGTDRAAIHTDRLISRWRPSAVVNVGVAGAIDDDVLLGDVVVARQIDNYLSAAKAIRSETGAYDFRLAGDPFKADNYLTSRLSELTIAHPHAHHLFEAAITKDYAESGEVISVFVTRGFMRSSPSIVEAHVASGPIVTQASSFAQWLKNTRDRSIKAIEMEGGGMALSAYAQKHHYRTLMLRGASDFGDERKKDFDNTGGGAIRRFAVRNAFHALTAALTTLRPTDIA